MPASYVKPKVKRQKNDATDAEAICEAVTRPTMRFVPVKSEEQQSVLMLHRARELLVRQRTMLINALRAHFAELGIIMRQGSAGVSTLIGLIEDDEHDLVPTFTRRALIPLAEQLRELNRRIADLDREIIQWHRTSELSRRLETIPCVGPVTASALSATIADASLFESAGRWPPGLVLCHDRIRVAARKGWDGSANRVILISASFPSAALMPYCDSVVKREPGQRSGPPICWSASRTISSR